MVPQRVSSNAPVSVRTQIRYAKMRKSLQKAQPGSGKKIPNAYRRVKSLDYEDVRGVLRVFGVGFPYMYV